MDSSSSKVTVEYHDPSGVFGLVSHDIVARLPLRNLNWQSASRPLRQIKSLHVDFVPDQTTQENLRPPSERREPASTDGPPNSLDIIRSGADLKRYAVKERRHQIPGLQTSPYLKIYVLRCDDKDTYKATERKKIREWIRDETAAASVQAKGKGRGENHDAFEWLILHVVIPDTVASSESRWRVSQKDVDELKERKASGKWPGKSSRTVFDKLRADFNETGKAGRDRVAQIKLLKNNVAADLLPTPPVARTLEETAEEREKAWSDLTTKLKDLILEPFDRRVRQYEADVTEQESRRSLPGFNFCTFFIHKEGLAKALESIGLVEDALVIYDELSLGLETVIRDLAAGQAQGTATTFAPYTDDIVERITSASTGWANGTSAELNRDKQVPGLFDKDYRQKIVTSTISIFDFASYLFTRQKALILRLANAKAARARLGVESKDGEDFVLTSEVCWRSSSYIHNNARTLRRDLQANKLLSNEWNGTSEDIESLVSSWTYAVAGLVLGETVTTAMDQVETTRRPSIPNGNPTSPRRADFSFAGLGANPYPQRTTSLATRKSRVSDLQKRHPTKSASESDVTSPPSSSGSDGTILGNNKIGIPGMPELATYRAELLMIQRKMLEHVARQRGWIAGWAGLRAKEGVALDSVNLDDVETTLDVNDNVHEQQTRTPSKFLSPTLAAALESESAFHTTYEHLSNVAMRNYVAATQTKSAESIMGDLAILKSQQGDNEYAANYFEYVLPLYAGEGWSVMEAEALRMQAKCLKALGRNEAHVETLLSLVARVCGRKMARKEHFSVLPTTYDADVEINGLLSELAAFSTILKNDMITEADRYFRNMEVDPLIRRDEHNDRDGFSVRLRLQHLLQDELELDSISVRLVHLEDSSQEIILTTSGPILVRCGLNEIDLATNTVSHGPFLIDRIDFRMERLVFTKSLQSKTPIADSSEENVSQHPRVDFNDRYKQPWVLLFPGENEFQAEINMAKHIQVDKPRSLRVCVSSGWNQIESFDLRLKPASAGLRLHLADAMYDTVEKNTTGKAVLGQLQFGMLACHTSAQVEIPYSLEQAAQEIFVRLEVRYRTPNGEFNFITSARLSTALGLDVNVHDKFHLDSLFSTFTVKTTGTSPLFVTGASLEASPFYHVQSPPVLPMPMAIYENHPINLLYKINKVSVDVSKISKQEAALKLNVHYNSASEIVLGAVRRTFEDALTRSPFAFFCRLLLPMLNERCKQALSDGQLEAAIALNEVRMPSYDEIGWDEVVHTLSSEIRLPLTSWLKILHKEKSRIVVQDSEWIGSHQHCITMPVEVPDMPIVHRTTLALLEHDGEGISDPPILTLGQPVRARLQLESTRMWGLKTTSSPIDNNQTDHGRSAESFLYDIHAESDTWLIGGSRRAQFTEGTPSYFDLTLLPLRLGILPLPRVDVHPVASSSDSPLIACETQCASAGQVVRVIRGSNTTRVEIPDGNTQA